MKNLKRDIQAVNKGLKALINKTDNLIKAIDKIEKTQAVKTKAGRKAVIKKAPVKKEAVKLTATDTIIKIIKRSKKGVDIPTLIRKSGYDEKKVRNIVFRTYKQGRIKRTGKGMYVGA